MTDIAIIDRVEDDGYQGKAFKKVTDKSGRIFNIKYGRGGALKEKWPLLVVGKSIELTWGSYNDIPFVQDFKVVDGGEEVAKLPPQPSSKVLPDHEKVIEEAKKSVSFDPTRKSIERQTSLNRAVEWCIAKLQGGEDVQTVHIISIATIFESYLEDGNVKKESNE